MHEGYGSCFMFVSITMPAATYLVKLYDANKEPLGFLWHFQGIYCVDLVENALFNSSGDIC